MVSTLSCAATGLTASIHQPRGCQPSALRRAIFVGRPAALTPHLHGRRQCRDHGSSDFGKTGKQKTDFARTTVRTNRCTVQYPPRRFESRVATSSTHGRIGSRARRTRRTRRTPRPSDEITSSGRIRRAAGEASRWTAVDTRVRECGTDQAALSYTGVHCRPRGPAARARRHPLLTTPTTHSDRQLPPEGRSHVASGLAGRYSIHAVLQRAHGCEPVGADWHGSLLVLRVSCRCSCLAMRTGAARVAGASRSPRGPCVRCARSPSTDSKTRRAGIPWCHRER
jgi:hypothetical protein